MKKDIVSFGSIQLVGICVRTCNRDEMNLEVAKIPGLLEQYSRQGLAERILHRVSPGVSYAVYTNFESDENGAYTYFFGEAVSSMDDQDLSVFEHHTIPSGTYCKLTVGPGTMPDVIIKAWQTIWTLGVEDWGGRRCYHSDFEVYDERAIDPKKAVVDICLGIDPNSLP